VSDSFALSFISWHLAWCINGVRSSTTSIYSLFHCAGHSTVWLVVLALRGLRLVCGRVLLVSKWSLCG